MNIVIGSDHIGLPLKLAVIEHLRAQGHEVTDVGAYSAERCDYPVYGYKAAQLVANGKADFGVLICGTGIGISLAANKVHGIRAAVCSESYSAYMARLHNNANMVAMGARVVGEAVALQIIDTFLSTAYEGGRHQRRIDMISAIEAGSTGVVSKTGFAGLFRQVCAISLSPLPCSRANGVKLCLRKASESTAHVAGFGIQLEGLQAANLPESVCQQSVARHCRARIIFWFRTLREGRPRW